MLIAVVKASFAIVLIAVAWVLVDRAWRKSFPDREHNTGCGSCSGCEKRCGDRE